MAIAALSPKPSPHLPLFPCTNIIHQQPSNFKKPQDLLAHRNLIPSQTVGSRYGTSNGCSTPFSTSDKSQNLNYHNQRFIITIPFSSFRNSNTPPPENQTDCPVPFEQQPINEYQALSESFPFSWASGDFLEYCSRLFAVGTSFAVFVGLPVSFGSVGVEISTLERFLAAVSTGLFVVTLAVVRMYLGWAYVGNRLLSATVEYEETGWYDGQVWVKTAEILARDRLLGSFSVKPVLNRLKNTLVILGTSLFICAVVFVSTEVSQKETYRISEELPGGRAVPGVYNDESARSFEPDAFCGEPGDIH